MNHWICHDLQTFYSPLSWNQLRNEESSRLSKLSYHSLLQQLGPVPPVSCILLNHSEMHSAKSLIMQVHQLLLTTSQF